MSPVFIDIKYYLFIFKMAILHNIFLFYFKKYERSDRKSLCISFSKLREHF